MDAPDGKTNSWEKPQLIVLGRGRPEESVLAACKNTGGGISGPENTDCWQADGSGTCRSQGGS